METAWSWAVTGYSHLHRRHEDICRTCRHAGLSGVEGSAELEEEDGEVFDNGVLKIHSTI